jgi:hypothetical protein
MCSNFFASCHRAGMASRQIHTTHVLKLRLYGDMSVSYGAKPQKCVNIRWYISFLSIL